MKLQREVYYHYLGEEAERRIKRNLAVVRHSSSERQCHRNRAELYENPIGNPSFYSSKWQTCHRGVPKGVGSEALDSCGRANDCHYNHHLHYFNHHNGSRIGDELLGVDRSEQFKPALHHHHRSTTPHLYCGDSSKPIFRYAATTFTWISWPHRQCRIFSEKHSIRKLC